MIRPLTICCRLLAVVLHHLAPPAPEGKSARITIIGAPPARPRRRSAR